MTSAMPISRSSSVRQDTPVAIGEATIDRTPRCAERTHSARLRTGEGSAAMTWISTPSLSAWRPSGFLTPVSPSSVYSVGWACSRWNRDNQPVIDALRNPRPETLLICYEDLIRDFDNHLRRIFDFLQLDTVAEDFYLVVDPAEVMEQPVLVLHP